MESRKRVAVVGGGINGAGIAWELARRDYDVVVFEKGKCGAQTSSRSTKMIHGGLRYLEHLHIDIVRESLRDRAWLLENLPQLVKRIEILLPIYDDSPRSRLTLRTGLTMYDALAGRENIHGHRVVAREELMTHAPLVAEGLRGGFSYWDAQTDDFQLVRTVIASAAGEGARIREMTRVDRLKQAGRRWVVTTSDDQSDFDFVVNAVGPWMNEFLGHNQLPASYVLSLVRGSHIVLRRRVSELGLLLQSIGDSRVFFVLPWKAATLVGTTEVVQTAPLDHVHPSDEEIDYLVERYNRYFSEPITRADIAAVFAGVRPLVGRASNPSAIARDYKIVRSGNLINVFGGKLTTFMSLARKVARRVDNYFGKPRTAREARFARSGHAEHSEVSPGAPM